MKILVILEFGIVLIAVLPPSSFQTTGAHIVTHFPLLPLFHPSPKIIPDSSKRVTIPFHADEWAPRSPSAPTWSFFPNRETVQICYCFGKGKRDQDDFLTPTLCFFVLVWPFLCRLRRGVQGSNRREYKIYQ